MNRIFLISIIVISISFLSVSAKDTGVLITNPGENAGRINELKLRLNLNETQVEELVKIFSASDSQKKIDVDLFGSSATALIRAAERRREITDSRVNDILTDLQKISFDKYKKERVEKRELFDLKEGLLLTAKQEIQAELVISEYEDILKRLYIRLDYYIKSGQDRKKKSSESGRLLKSRTGGLERRNPEVVKMEQGPPEKIMEIQKEKAKRIKEYLTDEQIRLYSELLKYQEQELKAYIRSLKR